MIYHESHPHSPERRKPVETNLFLAQWKRRKLTNQLRQLGPELSNNVLPDISTQVIRGVPLYERPPADMRTVLPTTKHQLSMSRGYDHKNDQFFYAINSGGTRFSTSPRSDDADEGFWEMKMSSAEDSELVSSDVVISYLSDRLSRKDRPVLGKLLDAPATDSVATANTLFDALSPLASSRIEIARYMTDDVTFEAPGIEFTEHPRLLSSEEMPFYEASSNYELRMMKTNNKDLQYDLICQAPIVANTSVTSNKKYIYSVAMPKKLHAQTIEAPRVQASVEMSTEDLSLAALRALGRTEQSSQHHYELFCHGLDMITQSHLASAESLS